MIRILSTLIAALICCGLHAQKDTDIMRLSLDENLEQPAISGKAVKPIAAHMDGIRASLAKHFKSVSTQRDGQVVVVEIPASALFAPNETMLLESGKPYLRPFVNMLKYPTMYKVVMAMHSDDTGDDQYANELTAVRAKAAADFLRAESGQPGTNVVTYGMGKKSPAVANNSIAGRAANRRLKIYIVPQWQLIDQAKSGKLK